MSCRPYILKNSSLGKNLNLGQDIVFDSIEDVQMYLGNALRFRNEVENKTTPKYSFTYLGKTIETDFQLTEEQDAALKRLIDYSIDKSGNRITLSGYAGTGKTSIIKYLEKFLGSTNFIYAAPSHSASAYLAINVGQTPNTIQSLVQQRMNMELGMKTYEESIKFKDLQIPGKSNILVIDEISMMENDYLESVLNVLDPNIQVIFMGDKAQLPQVTGDVKKVSIAFTDFEQIQLTEVKRTEDAGILQVLTEIRNTNDGLIPVVPDTETLKYHKSNLSFKNTAIEALRKNINNVVYITYTNRSVNSFNEAARNALGLSGDLKVGENIVGKAGYNTKKIQDGQVANAIKYEVTKVEQDGSYILISLSSDLLKQISSLRRKELYKIQTKYLQLSSSDSFVFQGITESHMKNNNSSVAAQFRNLYDAKQNAIQYRNWRGYYLQKQQIDSWLANNVLGGSYIYNPETGVMDIFNGTPEQLKFQKSNPEMYVTSSVNFGYAMTIHNSQGATFEEVFFDSTSTEGNYTPIMENGVQVNTEGNTLNYVAMSRASKSLNVLTGNNTKEITSSQQPNKSTTSKTLKLYHGTASKLDGDFDVNRSNTSSTIFLTDNESFANEFSFGDENRPDGVTYEVEATLTKTFDSNSEESIKELEPLIRTLVSENYKYKTGLNYRTDLPQINIGEKVIDNPTQEDFVQHYLWRAKSNWRLMESPRVIEYLKSKGYDSFTIKERGANNIAVFDPSKVVFKNYKNKNGITNNIENKTPKTTKDIYEALGNKTESENVVIKLEIKPGDVPYELEKGKKTFALGQNGVKYAESIGGIFSMRVSGTDKHFGNPFSSVQAEIDKGLIATKDTRESVEKYIDWVLNSDDTRAEWIREQLKSGKSKGKPIVYYTNTPAKKSLTPSDKTEPSHATALDYLINKHNWGNPDSQTKLPKQNILTINTSDKKVEVKAGLANKYVGFGGGTVVTSPQNVVNPGKYDSNDVVFVSVIGKEGDEIVRKQQQDKTIKEALTAIKSGATLILDNKKDIGISNIKFKEDSDSGYKARTIKNASADATIDFGFEQVGESHTKGAVDSNQKKYIGINANNLTISDEMINEIIDSLNSVNAKTLNIAGMGIYATQKHTQEQVDSFVYDLLEKVLNSPNLKNKIKGVRTGGQTGFDEAGAKAADKLGIYTLILAPKGYVYRTKKGVAGDIASKVGFINRFDKDTYNSGERRLYRNLENNGYTYSEQTVDGHVLGVWTNPGKKVKTEVETKTPIPGNTENSREYNYQDFAKDNKGKKVMVKYAKYDKPFQAEITGELEKTTGVGTDEGGEYYHVDIQVKTNTGKLLSATPFEIEGDLINLDKAKKASDKIYISKTAIDSNQQGIKLQNQIVETVSEDYGVLQVETNPTKLKTKEFIALIAPQIEKQLYKENAGQLANKMFHFGLMWARVKILANPLKIKSFAPTYNRDSLIAAGKDAGPKDYTYAYHEKDQHGNPLPGMSKLQPIIKEIEDNLGIDMSDYDSVIGNVYLDDEYIYPHKDTTESKSAENYPVIVYTLGNDAGLGIVDNNNGKMTFANQYDDKYLPGNDKLKGYTNEVKTQNGSIYTFGHRGKGRFTLTHSTPIQNKKKVTYPPIKLPDGSVVTNYTITLTFRRAKDLDANTPITPKEFKDIGKTSSLSSPIMEDLKTIENNRRVEIEELVTGIFPKTKIKKILYHGSESKFDNFKKEYFGRNTGNENYNDGTLIDSNMAFFFSESKSNTFQYSYIKKIEDINRLERILDLFISNPTAANAAAIREVSPILADHLQSKKKELDRDSLMKYLEGLQLLYRSGSKDLDTGFLNSLVNMSELEYDIRELKLHKRTILNGKYTIDKHISLYDQSTKITKGGGIFSLDKSLNNRNIKDLSTEEFTGLIDASENYITNFKSSLAGYIKKYKLTPNTYSVVLDIREPAFQDFNGGAFVYQPGEQHSNSYLASKFTESALKSGKDAVVFENIKDPILNTNYGVFEPVQIHILTEKELNRVDEINNKYDTKIKEFYENTKDNTQLEEDFEFQKIQNEYNPENSGMTFNNTPSDLQLGGYIVDNNKNCNI